MTARATARVPLATGMQGDAAVSRVAEGSRRITGHRRFTLHDVTIGDLPVGGATVDVWRDGGVQRWSARLLMLATQPLRSGLLAGTAAGGRRLLGAVHLGETALGPRRGREVLVEFHGVGPLGTLDPPPAPDEVAPSLDGAERARQP